MGSDLSCEHTGARCINPLRFTFSATAQEVVLLPPQIKQTTTVNALLQLITSAMAAAGLLTGLLLINTPVAIAAAASLEASTDC